MMNDLPDAVGLASTVPQNYHICPGKSKVMRQKQRGTVRDMSQTVPGLSQSVNPRDGGIYKGIIYINYIYIY